MGQYQAPAQHPTEVRQPRHEMKRPHHETKSKKHRHGHDHKRKGKSKGNDGTNVNNEIGFGNTNEYNPTNNNHVGIGNTNDNNIGIGNTATNESDSNANSDSNAYSQNNVTQGDSNSAASLTQGNTTNEFVNKTITIDRDNSAFYGFRGGSTIPNPLSLNLDVIYETEHDDDLTVMLGVQYNFGGGLRKLAKDDVRLSQLQTKMGICNDISAANLMIDYTKRPDLAFCDGLTTRLLPTPQPPAQQPNINIQLQQQQNTINSLRAKMKQLRTEPTLVKPTW